MLKLFLTRSLADRTDISVVQGSGLAQPGNFLELEPNYFDGTDLVDKLTCRCWAMDQGLAACCGGP